MSGQSIRPSQYITTYGPGSILEGPDGPRVISSLLRSGVFSGSRHTADFDITNARLSGALLDGAGVLRLPTNAELGVPDSIAIYDTIAFPSWSLCEGHRILYRYRWNDPTGCPQCGGSAPGPLWGKARHEAIRFVRVCREGHLDDVDWVGIIPHGRPNCRPSYLEWTGQGGALRNIDVQCPDCGRSINLGLAYGRDWPCSGRLPETGTPAPGGCNLPGPSATLIQRGAANLRVPEIISSITVPPRDSPLHRILSRAPTEGAFAVSPPPGKQAVLNALNTLAQRHRIPASDPIEVARYSDAEIMAAVGDVLADAGPVTASDLRAQEFLELQRAAAHGHPAVPARTPGAPPLFEVIPSDVRTFNGPQGGRLRVTPVTRLQVTMVQIGYRRVVADNPFDCRLVSVTYNDGQREWYPGVELFGEGIFLDFASNSAGQNVIPSFGSGVAAMWQGAWADPVGHGRQVEQREQLNPLFVWWHTLAHRFVTALAVDSGYSSAAVRERIYTRIDPATGRGEGGILLYTAQPGGDGTLGGLVSLVPNFDRVLERAFRDLDACSNDPLCSEEHFGPDRYNGAACYACLLVSETSCEFRNTSLDRNLLLNNLP